MTEAFVVPIRVDGLVVDGQTRLLGPFADFDRLPYNDGAKDVNPGRAFLSSEVFRPPGARPSTWLEPGVHLHWALPRSLTRGRPAGSAPQGFAVGRVAGMDLPLIPNRWLVGTPEGWWVVESDYLHPEGADASRSAVSYLLTPQEREQLGRRAPYCYLGRTVPLADWTPYDQTAEYLPTLTAAGWGHPAFHAYYPNCRSVLGCHLPVSSTGTAPEGPYEVFGWYSQLGMDPIAALASERAGADGAWLRARIFDTFGWSSPGTEEWPWARPDRMLCVGRLDAVPTAEDERATASRRVDAVVVAATGAEALAAHLGHLHQGETAGLLEGARVAAAARLQEEALETVLLSARVQLDRPDAYAALREARHDKAFVAVAAGSVWTVRPRTVGLPADAGHSSHHGDVRVGADVTDLVASLNARQGERDRLDRQTEMLRASLYADWCKYAECRCRPPLDGDELPDADEVRRFIETDSLAELEATLRAQRMAGAAVSDHVAQLMTRLAEQDVQAMQVHVQDVVDWPLLARLGADEDLLTKGLLNRLHAGPDDPVVQADVVVFLNRLMAAGEALHRRDPDTFDVDRAVARWLASPPPDMSELARTLGHVVAALFPDEVFPDEVFPDEVFPEEHPGALSWLVAQAASSASIHDAQRNRAALELLFSAAITPVPKVHHELDVKPGPRFWHQRDPVVLLHGDAVAHPPRHARSAVFCRVLPIGPEPGHWLAAALHRRQTGGGSDTSNRDIADEFRSIALAGSGASDGDASWNPILADWKAALHERAPSAGDPHRGDPHRYDRSFLTDRYELAEDGPDLEPLAPAAPSRRTSLVSGRSLLTPHAVTELAEALRDRVAPPPDRQSQFLEATVAAAQRFLDTDGTRVQTLSLSGFNAALLMHEPITPLPIEDPLAFPEAQEFASRVAAAIGDHTSRAPRALLDFMPIRAGSLELVEIALIDSFGRSITVELGADTGTEVRASHAHPQVPVADVASGEAELGAATFELPPRLAVPARLRARWLAAGPAGTADDTAHAGDGGRPICGWLLPSVIENRLMVHGPDGAALGSIDEDGRWRPPPGQDRFIAPGDIPDGGLRRVVLHLLHRTGEERGAFLFKVLESLETIAPDTSQRQAVSLFMGRPIAVVRAALRLELLGVAPRDQGWTAFEQRLRGDSDVSAGLTDVRFPVRLGEVGQLDDGVVGFWVERGDQFADERFYTPQLAGTGPANTGPANTGPANTVTLALDEDPTTVTMLLDPRGKVHVTTGILPTKVLDLPAGHYVDALHAIGVTFLCTPVLTAPDALELALPALPGFAWSWLERDLQGWRELDATAFTAPPATATLRVAQELREGWLRLAPSDPVAGPR